MKSVVLFPLVLAGAMTAGYALRGGTTPDSADAGKPKSTPSRTTIPETWIEDALKEQSSDSIEDLVTDHTATRHPRMTLWLIDASAAEIRELWQTLDKRGELDSETYHLVLIHWAQHDPRNAIAAARSIGREDVGWWAWGKADPELALQTAVREAPEFADIVLHGIGQFHPELALQLMEEHPETLGYMYIYGTGFGLMESDPQQALAFYRSQGLDGQQALKRWAEQEPDEALRWARSHIRKDSDDGIQPLVSTLVADFPDRVDHWRQELPVGGLRRALEEEYIRHLADQDVDKAIAFAKAENSPGGRSRLMGAVGERLVYHNPEASLSLLRETIAEHDKAKGDNGYLDYTLGGGAAIHEWQEQLIATHPEQVVETYLEIKGNRPQSKRISQVMSQWMKQDEVGYAEWLIDREPDYRRDRWIGDFVNHLTTQNNSADRGLPDYEAALGWAAAVQTETGMQFHRSTVVARWMQADPASARAHFENLPINDPARKAYENHPDR